MVSEAARKISEDAVMKRLAEFDVAEAMCYDPNEERKLREVIDAAGGMMGGDKFVSQGSRLVPPFQLPKSQTHHFKNADIRQLAKEVIKRRHTQEEADATALLANTVQAIERSATFIASSGSELVMAGLEKGGSITSNVAGSAKTLLEKGGSITNNVAGSAKTLLGGGSTSFGSSAKSMLGEGSGSFDATRSGSFMGDAQKPSVFGKLFRSQTPTEISARHTGDDRDYDVSGHSDLVETDLDSNKLTADA
mmetsp:Transcript_57992/g.160262  ORF Transcript_57992/g.160262 Transcript_57992/m.160262 type:complete len:250 (-) Transcript_57992:87-836(-)